MHEGMHACVFGVDCDCDCFCHYSTIILPRRQVEALVGFGVFYQFAGWRGCVCGGRRGRLLIILIRAVASGILWEWVKISVGMEAA